MGRRSNPITSWISRRIYFEIKWQSGDVTWMPYYQIKHLQALSDYFELLGIQNISELPKGKGSLPQEDPQIFLGSVSMSMSSPLPASIHFDNTNYVPRDQESPFINPDVPLILTSSLTSPTSDTCPSTLKLPMTCLTYLGYNTPISLVTVKPNTQSLSGSPCPMAYSCWSNYALPCLRPLAS